jgi:hypothetical protein
MLSASFSIRAWKRNTSLRRSGCDILTIVAMFAHKGSLTIGRQVASESRTAWRSETRIRSRGDAVILV